MLPPEGTGRAHVRRPMRLSGVVEREALAGGPLMDAFATVLGRFPSVGTKPRRRGIGECGRQGLKSPLRSGTRQRPARRGPPLERVKNPRSEGFRITAA